MCYFIFLNLQVRDWSYIYIFLASAKREKFANTYPIFKKIDFIRTQF